MTWFWNVLFEPLLPHFPRSLHLIMTTHIINNQWLIWPMRQVRDEYIHFVSLDTKLISFNVANSYVIFNDTTLSNRTLNDVMDSVVHRILDTLITWGRLPLLLAPSNSLSAEIALVGELGGCSGGRRSAGPVGSEQERWASANGVSLLGRLIITDANT